jgi:hypothetical protein
MFPVATSGEFMLDGDRISHPPVCGWERSRSMAKKKKKGPVKKRSAKAKPKGGAKKSAKKLTAKKTKKKTVRKKSVAKAKTAPKKKAAAPRTSRKTPAPAAQEQAIPFLEEEPKKAPLSKPVPAAMPKVTDLDDEEIVDEEIEIGAEGELDEDMEEELALDDNEEDVDYLEKSGDLLDDSDDYRH